MFNNIDALPLGKLLGISGQGPTGTKKKKSSIRQLMERGFNSGSGKKPEPGVG